jgi:hypothetical protein
MNTFSKYPIMTTLHVVFIGISILLSALILFFLVPEVVSGTPGKPGEPFYALGATMLVFLSPFLITSVSGAAYTHHLLKKYTDK